jgi:Kef-type K+ transport system membrane component KefB
MTTSMTTSDPVLFTIFLIFTGAAVLATAALYARQALLVSYILLGILFGPWGFALVTDALVITEFAHVGIIFLLFLLGLNLHPQKLLALMRQTTIVTAVSSGIFALSAAVVGWLFGLNPVECLLLGSALMFSSTIIGLKLLPTLVLHHQRTGELIISVLLLQDLIAIAVLLLVRFLGRGALPVFDLLVLLLSLPVLILVAFLGERYVLVPLMRRFDGIHEYVFLLIIGWCLGLAELATYLGLSAEVGAFIAGVAVATNPVSLFIAETLKPLRDFFLVIFFFSLGASFDLNMLSEVLFPACLLAALTLLFKPLVFAALLRRAGETAARAGEVGVRLGQLSEFSLLIAVVAADLGVIGTTAAYLIQASTLFTFIVSPYVIVLNFPTPIAVSKRLRRN